VVNHHKQVAYIAYSLGKELDLTTAERSQLVFAGALHDIGALSLKERLDALKFDNENLHMHAEAGYTLLKTFKPLANAASIIRHHHVLWEGGKGSQFKGRPVSIHSHILHLADRISVLFDPKQDISQQVGLIIEKIADQSDKMFIPDLVQAFRSLAVKEYFWLDLSSPSINSVLRRRVQTNNIDLNMDGLLNVACLFSQIIDFRSHFTSTHSSGVSACAKAIAHKVGFSYRECRLIRVAGYLHDLGKLAIPKEILEKPEKLTPAEFAIIKRHTYYTYRILESIVDINAISQWAAFHHERLDGNGYPFHLNSSEIPLGSRIMAVADVFTAITEDRPYRKGMKDCEVLKILQKMADDSALDSMIVSVVKSNFDDINSLRKEAELESANKYRNFLNLED